MIRVRVSSRSRGPALCFDLENRPLAYWYDGQTTSEITAFGWKWENERKVHVLLLQPNGSFVDENDVHYSDEGAYQWFWGELCRAGVVYGHNIRRHDLPMLNAGLIRRSLDPLPALLTTDTCRDLPKTGGVSKSLENMAAMYGLPGKKHVMSQPAWEQANRLTPGGVTQARVRVSSDVLLQERLRKKLLELQLLKPARVWRG